MKIPFKEKAGRVRFRGFCYLIFYAQIWKTEDLHLVGELDAQQNGISCFASHGNRLYAGTAGGNIIVFDIEKGSVIKELNQHEGSVLVLRVLHGHLYSGDTEGKVLNIEVKSYILLENIKHISLGENKNICVALYRYSCPLSI